MIVMKLPWDSQYVLSVKDAVTVAEILQNAYSWKEEYVSGGPNMLRAFPSEGKVTMELISEDMFRMAKLAGKPEKKS